MKRFSKFLLEQSQQTLNPRRQDFPEGQEGQQQYLQALRDTSEKQRAEAETMTRNAENREKVLGNVETGLKAAETIADAGLSVGAVAVPGIGTGLNAAVKGIKSIAAGRRGDYLQASLYGADAVLPAVGSLAAEARAAGGLINSAGEVATLGRDITKFVSNPIAQAVEQGVTRIPQVSRAVQSTTNTLNSMGLSQPAANLLTNTAVKSTLKLGGDKVQEKVKPMRLG